MLSNPLRTNPLRVALVAVAALLIGGAVFAPGLLLRWFDGPGRPVKPPPRDTMPTVDVAREHFAFTWPARGDERPAPELSMRVLPTDWHGWWASKAKRTLPPDGPGELLMEVSVPNADAILPEDMAPLCTAGGNPLDGCAGARARVQVFRDDTDWSRADVLLGRRAPDPQMRVTRTGASVPVIHEFWTRRERETGRDRFLGWQCQAGKAGLPLPWDAQARPQSLYTCFEPVDWWVRKWPGLFGYRRNRVYTSCNGDDVCEMNFLFAQRLVRLEFVDLVPSRDRELARFRLLLSAWEMLNRQRSDAAWPARPTAELAEARAQLAMCESAAAAFVRLDEQERRAMTDSQPEGLPRLSIFCERAANIAIRSMAADASQSESLLGRAIHGLADLEIRNSRSRGLFDAWFAALAARGRGDSLEALQASLLYLRASPHHAEDDPEREEHLARVRATRALLTRFGPGLPEEAANDAYTRLGREHQGDAQQPELVALRKEHAALVARRHGETSREMLKPLQALVSAQWNTGDIAELKESVGRLRAAWLHQAAKPDAIADHDSRLLVASSGFDAVFGLRIVAFREKAFAAVTPQIEEVVRAMQSILGDADPFVQAARFHQREVVTGRAVEGATIGGGFLPNQY